MMKILPLALHLLMRLGEQSDRLASAVAPLLAPRDPALRFFQRTLGFAIPARRKDACAISECRERLYPQVYARFLSSGGKWREVALLAHPRRKSRRATHRLPG